MLSGALLLSRPIEHPREFLARRAKRITLAIFAWSAIYFVWRRTFHHESITMAVVVRDFVYAKPYYHLYFLFVIGGLYAAAPALSYAVDRTPVRIAIWSTFGALALAFATVTISLWSPTAFTFFVPYLGYFLLGALIARRPLGLRLFCVWVFFVCVLLTAIATEFTVRYSGPLGPWGLYFYSYFSPTVILMAISAFVIFAGLEVSAELAGWVTWFAPMTLGVYLVHPIVLEVVRSLIGDATLLFHWHALDVPVTFILVTAISTAVVMIARNNSIARAII
jgi:surface polysaccharide O-acyltransferase-like enzyme